jgi:hypothetical protein
MEFKEVMKSQGLKHFINLVLLAGNFMGKTKDSKGTFAFELGVLNRVILINHIFHFLNAKTVGGHQGHRELGDPSAWTHCLASQKVQWKIYQFRCRRLPSHLKSMQSRSG